MDVKSKDDSREARDEKANKKYERIMSVLDRKEKDLKKSIESLEEKLVTIRFEEEIREKQSLIARLAQRRDELSSELRERKKKLLSKEEKAEETEETGEKEALPIVVEPPKLNLEAIRKTVKERKKKGFW